MEYILITGASSGIGRQCAIQLSQNYNLILCARREDKLKETKSLCQNPNKHLIFCCDLSDIKNIENNLIEFIKKNQISINKFLHCAGVRGIGLLKGYNVEFIENCFSINLFSSMLITKILASKRYNNKGLNNIVLISSLNTLKASKGTAVYSASKSGLDAFTRGMSVELAPNVRVNSILPGLMPSEMTKQIYNGESQIEEITSNYPIGSGDYEDIANMVEFLFSDKAKWITGQQISVDGGASI